MSNTNYYRNIKNKFFIESDNDFISNLSEYDDQALIQIIKGLQSDIYADNMFFSNFKKRIHKLLKEEDQRLFSIFNVLFCFQVDLLEVNLSYLADNFIDFNKLLQVLLSGSIRHHPRKIEFLISYNGFSESPQNKNLLKKFFLARGYSFNKIHEILGIDSHNNPLYSRIKKRKIALLISGQVRGFEAALDSWKRSFDFTEVDLDVFISTWQQSYQPKQLLLGRFGSAVLSDRIRELLNGITEEQAQAILKKYLPPQVIDEDYLTNLCNKYFVTNNIQIEIEAEEKYPNFTNPMKLYYKIYRAFEISKQHGVYDLYIRIRPDLHLSNKNAIDLRDIEEELTKQRCILTHYPYVFEYYGFGVDDKIAIGKFDCMQIYSNTWIFDGNNPNALGHVNLASNLAYHQVNCKKIEGLDVSFSNYNILDISQVENEFNKID